MTNQSNRGAGKASVTFSYGMPVRKKAAGSSRSQMIYEVGGGGEGRREERTGTAPGGEDVSLF